MTEPFIDRIAKNDNAVKTIFDHIRNIGLCAILLAASGWKYRHFGVGVQWYVDAVTFAFLLIVSFLLLWLNSVHGLHKLRAATIPKWAKVLIGGSYSALVAAVIMSLLTARNSG